MGLTRGDNVVIRALLLQHQPHRLHIVARVPPIPSRVQVAQLQLRRQAVLDARDAIGDLSAHKLLAAARGLMVEQDTRAGEQSVAFPVVDRDPVTVELGHTVWASRIERCSLVLRHLLSLTEYLAGACLINPYAGIHKADRLQKAGYPHGSKLSCQDRLLPRGRDKRLRGEVIDLVRPDLPDEMNQRRLVEQVRRLQRDPLAKVRNSLERLGAGSPQDRKSTRLNSSH